MIDDCLPGQRFIDDWWFGRLTIKSFRLYKNGGEGVGKL